MRIELQKPHLRVISAILSNIASALLLLPLTVRDLLVLTISLFFAIVSIAVAIKIEAILDDL